MVGGDRGRVMGAIAVMGCIAGVGGTDGQPMLMGAMIMGPLAGFVIKKFDQAMDGRMPAGFEMLINNFSVGILGMVMAILGYYAIGPVMSAILAFLSAGVNLLVQHSLLPLVSIVLEPAKVLFLNNAINHGVFTPIGAEQVAEAGKSIMYMLETNPGPGLGVLVAYWLFSKDRTTKDSAPGAIIIHLFGGIHERPGGARLDHRLPDDVAARQHPCQPDRRHFSGGRLVCHRLAHCQNGRHKEPRRRAEQDAGNEGTGQGDGCTVRGSVDRLYGRQEGHLCL